MKLSVLERIALLDALPGQGNYLTLKIVRQLRESLSFSEEEHKALGFRQEGDRIFWDQDGAQEVDIPIGEKAADIIVEALKMMDKEGKLTDREFSCYEKFVEGKT